MSEMPFKVGDKFTYSWPSTGHDATVYEIKSVRQNRNQTECFLDLMIIDGPDRHRIGQGCVFIWSKEIAEQFIKYDSVIEDIIT